MSVTWKEHLAWCKERALRELDGAGGPMACMGNAIASMMQDVALYEGEGAPDEVTRSFLARMAMFEAMTGDPRRVRLWIEGWN